MLAKENARVTDENGIRPFNKRAGDEMAATTERTVGVLVALLRLVIHSAAHFCGFGPRFGCFLEARLLEWPVGEIQFMEESGFGTHAILWNAPARCDELLDRIQHLRFGQWGDIRLMRRGAAEDASGNVCHRVPQINVVLGNAGLIPSRDGHAYLGSSDVRIGDHWTALRLLPPNALSPAKDAHAAWVRWNALFAGASLRRWPNVANRACFEALPSRLRLWPVLSRVHRHHLPQWPGRIQ